MADLTLPDLDAGYEIGEEDSFAPDSKEESRRGNSLPGRKNLQKRE